MEERWSDGWLPAVPSQMAAGTVLRLADSQRTSKLRRARKLISARSQEAKGTGQRKETAIDKDCGSQKSQQAWKGAALAFFTFSSTHFRLFFSYLSSPLLTFHQISCLCFSAGCMILSVLIRWKQSQWHIPTKVRNGNIICEKHLYLSSDVLFPLIWFRLGILSGILRYSYHY